MRVVFVGRQRKAWRLVLASVATLGIARRVWLYRVNRELDGHAALGLRHGLTAALLVLPVLGPSLVTLQTARRTADVLAGSPVPYGNPWLVWLGSVVPLFGTILFFVPFQQGRLNRYWAHERTQGAHGIEVDVEPDPRFLVEMGRALRESYRPESPFEAKARARRERWQARSERWARLQAERRAVREAGGSTPVLPWVSPRRPALRILHVTCGTCNSRFDVRRDPAADTPIVCPGCGQAEVLPSLHSDPLRRPQPAAVPRVKADCPACGTTFHALRDLRGPTTLTCPKCGRTDILGPPGKAEAKPQRRKAARPETTSA